MTRLMRGAVLAIIALAVFAGIFGGARDVDAGKRYAQWTSGYSDGCAYYWDGYAFTMRACPRTDSGFDFSVASHGRWVYTFSAGWTTNGGVWLYYQGWYYIATPAYGYVGGGNGNIVDQTHVTIGAPNWSGLTGNVLVDQIVIDGNDAIIDTILRPTCVEIVGDTCYY